MIPSVALLSTLFLTSSAPAFDAQGQAVGHPLSERVVTYAIDAHLDPLSQELTGQEALEWLNRSDEPQSVLWFHLYWNAFKNDRSTFYRDAKRLGGVRDESARSPDYPKREKDDWGYSDITSFSVSGGADLLPTVAFQHPDDDNAEDQTVFTVTLPQAVPPHQKVKLDITWRARVPKLVARAGHQENFYLLGQWFPKIGVLEIPPERGATKAHWNCHQYHSDTEFYSDFGTFDARLTTPREFKVGAVGVLVDKTDNVDGTTTSHFHQDDIHDFAWTAWPRFEVVEDVFQAAGFPEMKLTFLLNPDHHRSRAQVIEAMKTSLQRYADWWSPLPYSHFTVVDVPVNAVASGGMEYPTFITIDTRRDPDPSRDYIVWQVVAHELAHNYWYGLLASNEFEEAWLDEGMTSYGTAKLTQAEHVSLNVASLIPEPLRESLSPLMPAPATQRELIQSLARAHWDSPIVLPAWKYRTLGDYGENSYGRPELTLFALEDLLGEETMAKVMRTYVERWKFRHPRSEDFFAVANEVSGQNLDWFWDSTFRDTRVVDYSVSDIRCISQPSNKRAGFFDRSGSHIYEAFTPLKPRPDADLNRCEVDVDRVGDARFPVNVRVTFDDGTSRVEHWNGQSPWQQWIYERPGVGGAVSRVDLDNQGILQLDPTFTNNARTRKFQPALPTALFGWLTYFSQLLVSLSSVLG